MCDVLRCVMCLHLYVPVKYINDDEPIQLMTHTGRQAIMCAAPICVGGRFIDNCIIKKQVSFSLLRFTK